MPANLIERKPMNLERPLIIDIAYVRVGRLIVAKDKTAFVCPRGLWSWAEGASLYELSGKCEFGLRPDGSAYAEWIF
jgi:hypothetical protein